MKKLPLILVLILVSSSIVFSGGSSQPTAQPGLLRPLRIGLMPAVDILPILAAYDLGLFEEEGVKVELEIFSSAVDRQSAVQAGTVDGILTDLVALALNVQSGFPLVGTLSTQGMFMVLAQGSRTPEPGNRASIGLMQVSVTNFLADQWVGDQFDLDKVFINDLGIRLEALVNGQTDLGFFPEPLASVGILRGLEIVDLSRDGDESPQIIAFTQEAISSKPDSVQAFHRAYARGVTLVLNDQDLARDLLIDYIPNINPAIRNSIRLPQFTQPSLPSSQYIQQVLDWTQDISGRALTVSPDQLVDSRFIQGF
jgi:NitT/TauT family transport system substrate-binding protein